MIGDDISPKETSLGLFPFSFKESTVMLLLGSGRYLADASDFPLPPCGQQAFPIEDDLVRCSEFYFLKLTVLGKFEKKKKGNNASLEVKDSIN